MTDVDKTLGKSSSEKKLWSLLSNLADKEKRNLLEASGVVVVDDDYLVVFDDMHGIARIPKSPDGGFRKGEIIGPQKQEEGFEAIAYDSRLNLLYAVVEDAPSPGGGYRPRLQELTMDLVKVGNPVELPLNLPLDNVDPNKGLEGAAVVHKGDHSFLFGLCEGRGCNSDDSKNADGRGMIQVFEKTVDKWEYLAPVLLPVEADFRDFSDLAIRGDRVAVVSQKSSKLWIGKLVPHLDSWKLIHEDIYSFPKKKNKSLYCNVEGVDWITDSQLVIVSDKARKKRCKEKEMMIHVFDIPS